MEVSGIRYINIHREINKHTNIPIMYNNILLANLKTYILKAIGHYCRWKVAKIEYYKIT